MIMKRKILTLLFITIILTSCLTGCADKYGVDENPNILKTNANAEVGPYYGTYEWVSPDGVHYWVFDSNYRYGIAPRYDSKGKLVIDKE